MNEVEAFGEGRESFRVHVNGCGMGLDGLVKVSYGGAGGVVGFREVGRRGVETGHFVDAASDDGEAVGHGVVLLGEACDGGAGKLEDSGRIAGLEVGVGEGGILAGLEASGLDFLGLVREEVALLMDGGGVVTAEAQEIPVEGIALVDEGGDGTTQGQEVAEGVEDVELACGLEQGLVVMGPVEVHEALAKGGQRGEGGGRAVDELSVDAVGGDGASDDEGPGLAGVEAGRREDVIHGGLATGGMEDGLDGAQVGACPDRSAVGTLADDELDGSQDDGLARAGFAGEHIEAWMQFQGQVGYQGKVSDAKRREHEP